ncbi:MAG: heme-binding protein [Dehalococcoidia bacterium]|nr:heme-binding protein [Dehalococcoidia bacterium]|tara:strand:+ start:1414 stop:1827 length:414 start_codon:yes stop_codon:yes gene_type:complete
MPTMTLLEAESIIEGAKVKIEELGVKMSVSVTDARGDLIAMIRTDGASWRTPFISRGKAVASACFGEPSGELEDRSNWPVFQAFTVLQDGHFIMGQGAIPIYKEGEIVGAVGASGGKSQEDEDVCRAALEHAGLKSS